MLSETRRRLSRARFSVIAGSRRKIPMHAEPAFWGQI
jgi:hypothetical protein